MKAENVTKGINSSANKIVESLRNKIAIGLNAMPHFTRVTEKFNMVQNYKIRDGF